MKNFRFLLNNKGFVAIPLLSGLLGAWAGGALWGTIGASIGYIVGSVLGSYFFPTKAPERDLITSNDVQNASVGGPVPIVYGTRRLAGNIIWVGTLHPYTPEYDKKDSKGGSGGGKTVEGASMYRRSFLIGICQGPATVLRMWAGKDAIGLSNATFYKGDGNSGLDSFDGGYKYKDLCCAYFAEYDLGTTEAIPNFNFEVKRYGNIGWDDTRPTLNATTHDGYMWVLTADKADSPDYLTLWRSADGLTWRELTTSIPYRSYSAFYSYGDYLYVVAGYDYDDVWRIENLDDEGIQVDRVVEHIGIHNDQKKAYPFKKGGKIYLLTYASYMGTNYHELFSSEDCINWTYEGETTDMGLSAPYIQFTQSTYNEKFWIKRAGSSASNPIFWSTDLKNWTEEATDKSICSHTGVVFNNKMWAIGGGTGSFGSCTIRKRVYSSTNGINWTIENDNAEFGYKSGHASVVFNECVWMLGGNYNSYYDPNGSYADVWYSTNAISWKRIFATDINPAFVIRDLLTNTKYGASIPEEYIDNASFAEIVVYCENKNYFGAWIINSQKPILDWIDYICSHFKGYLVMNGAKIKLGVFKEDYLTIDIDAVNQSAKTFTVVGDLTRYFTLGVPITISGSTGNDGAYTVGESSLVNGDTVIKVAEVIPDSTADGEIQYPAFYINQDNLIVEGDTPPVSVKKREYKDTYNRIEVEWVNRANNYGRGIAVANDEVDQRISKSIRNRKIQLDGIMTSALAGEWAYRYLADSLYRYSFYSFALGYKNMVLQPGDVGVLSDGYSIFGKKTRITSVQETKDGKNLSIEAVEDTPNLYGKFDYSVSDGEWTPPDEPTLLSPNAGFYEWINSEFVHIILAPQNNFATAFLIYRSYDDTSFKLIGTLAKKGTHGNLTTALPSENSLIYKPIQYFEVDVGEQGSLISASEEDFFSDRSICKIDDEFIAFQTVELIEGGEKTYRITGLIRGLYNTKPEAHAIDSKFILCQNDFGYSYGYDKTEIGKTLYFKFLTIYGKWHQELEDVDSQSYTVLGQFYRPAPSSLIHIKDRAGMQKYTGANVTIGWNICSKDIGYNKGGYGSIGYGVSGTDPELQNMILRIEKEDETLLEEKVLVKDDVEEVITPSENTVVAKVIPARDFRDLQEKSLTLYKV